MNLIINDFFKDMTIEKVLNAFKLSKQNIYKLKKANKILLNGIVMPIESIVEFGDELYIDTSEIDNTDITLSKQYIKIVYEDLDIVIVEKERGVLVHSDGINNDSALNRLANYYNKNNINVSLRVVHRIDTQTTGLVVFSKNVLSASYLGYLFENNEVDKKYLALVWGNVIEDEGKISSSIGRNRHTNKQRISNTGKNAITEFEVLERTKDKTLLDVKIQGGRRHQIRVHLSSIGHPIVGDEIYGKKDKMEMMLKFYQIKFIHPRTRKEFLFELPKKILNK
ncbi:MAG: RluA family pseudouridine synthase [Bacilli bacterium]